MCINISIGTSLKRKWEGRQQCASISTGKSEENKLISKKKYFPTHYKMTNILDRKIDGFIYNYYQ